MGDILTGRLPVKMSRWLNIGKRKRLNVEIPMTIAP
jgi:hypothetical protein